MTKKVLVVVLYFTFFLCGILFVNHSVEEYMEGSTGYSVRHEPLTLNDLPTTKVCYDFLSINYSLKYGKDIIIKAALFEKGSKVKVVTLSMDKKVLSSIGVSFYLRELVLGVGDRMQCLAITPK